jgi:SsrA-binding protein
MSQRLRHSGIRLLASNRKVYHNYNILEKYEAGIELRGSEVKSIKNGNVNLAGGYVKIENGEAILYDVNVAKYQQGAHFSHDPLRPRRLLLHKSQIRKLASYLEKKGFSIIPLSIYLKNGLIKVEISACKGKKLVDRREELRKKSMDREIEREMRKKIHL